MRALCRIRSFRARIRKRKNLAMIYEIITLGELINRSMSKALKTAIEANDPAAAAKVLKTVNDLSRKLPKAEAPLIYACKIGAAAVIDVLLDAGAPLRGKSDYEGNHPLAIAAEHGHAKVVERLTARGLPANVLGHALFSAVLDGREEVVCALLKHGKSAVSQRTLEVSTWWKDGRIFNLLLKHGADVNQVNDGSSSHEQLGETALHDAAGSGRVDSIRMLLDNGANVNAVDAVGRTPLMHLAASMPRLDQELRITKEREQRVLTEAQKAQQEKIAPQTRRHGDRAPADGMAAARLLLEAGAEAARKDRFGNDAIMYYEWERWRDREERNAEFIGLLQKAGAHGGGATAELIWAIAADDPVAAGEAIEAGADVDHMMPPPCSSTPLLMSRSAAMVELLIKVGANVNKPSLDDTPLISAAGSGESDIVQLLVKAGADIHAIQPRPPGSEYIANAYSAADMNSKHDVVEYLKSLGAGQPVLPDWKPLEAGVHMWENFSELLVKGSVSVVASALAKFIGGKVEENVYGMDLVPGKKTYAVLRPKGMDWCNLMQLAPPPDCYNPDLAFPRELAKTSGLPVILVQYSDAAGATEIERFAPDGSSQKDDGWDEDMLEEIVGELGHESSSDMKARLAEIQQSAEEEPTSESRLTTLAKQEKFAVAWGSLRSGLGRKVELAFTNLPAEAFDGTAWVSD
jgi:ankyrin repeat protein